MEWNGCIKMMQGYLENGSVIVLGSGASVPCGLPSMGVGLANEIKQNSIINTIKSLTILIRRAICVLLWNAE